MASRRSPEPADMITIAEAAKILAVSLPTMRRWDENGKFPARRHPISGYRIYLRRDVMNLRKKIIEGERAA